MAEMKAVILSICPEANIVDISHEIEKFSIRMGAYVLACAVPYFPKRTIHVAVVDPGVGTKRKPILIQTRNAYFIGPDNGILTLAIKDEKIVQIREIANRKLMMPPISNTFHGRDIFAPTAAHLATNTKPEDFGKQIHRIVMPDFTKIIREKGKLIGKAIHVDDFGNIVTNFGEGELKLAKADDVVVLEARRRKIKLKICRNYAEAQKRQTIGIIGSHRLLEISIRRASAARRLNIRTGDEMILYDTEENEQD